MQTTPQPAAFTINRRKLAAGIAVTLASGALSLQASRVDAQDIQTRVQILHAASDADKIEVHINDSEVLDEFEYGDISDWIDLDPGTARVTITADRLGFNYVILDAVYPVPAGNDYYVVITDALLLGGAFDQSSVPGDGARVQVTHASVDIPPVTIVATGQVIDLGTGLAFARSSESAPLPAGTYDFEVTLADSGESLLTKTGVVIEGGASYQLVFVGVPDDDDHPLDIITLETALSVDS